MKHNNNKTYAIAFSNGQGTPTRLLSIPFIASLKEAKEKLGFYIRKARADGHKTFGKTWGYVAVELNPVR
jgi:hypothetical protein